MAGWGNVPGVVELPGGRRVRGTGVRRPRQDVPPSHVTVYLLAREPSTLRAEDRWVCWRDFWLPRSTTDAVDALREAHARAADERVEIACGGGIGRTGTAIALLAVMAGIEPEGAVSWVREHYHPRAVETRWQRGWVRRVGAQLIA